MKRVPEKAECKGKTPHGGWENSFVNYPEVLDQAVRAIRFYNGQDRVVIGPVSELKTP